MKVDNTFYRLLMKSIFNEPILWCTQLTDFEAIISWFNNGLI